jgi:hypothetical protein
MGSQRPYRSRGQRRLAGLISLAILSPLSYGGYREMAAGLRAVLNRSQPIEAEREPTALENRIDAFFSKPTVTDERVDPDFSTFDYRTRVVEPSPENAYRLATSLLNLGPALEPIGRVAAQNGVPENLLYTIATFESQGGAVLIPHEYPQTKPYEVADSTPAGFFHAKLISLEEAINGAASARTRLENLNLESMRGWPSIEDARDALPETAYEQLLEQYPSQRRTHIALQLAVQVPEGTIDDRFDPEQSARGAIAYVALIDAHLQAEGVSKPSLAQILSLYTGGHNDAEDVAGADDDDVGRLAANTRGERYVRDGEEMHAVLDAYGSVDHAVAAAHELTAFRENRPDATVEILGTLYAQAAAHPDAFASFDEYIIEQRALDMMKWTPIAQIWDSYQNRTTLASR